LPASTPPQYLRKYISSADQYTTPDEIKDETLFAYQMATDPNAIPYLSKDTPLVNLLKRYRVQIELWKNINNLRQGNVYASGDYDSANAITGFTSAIAKVDYAYVDNPALQFVQDEGTLIRKLLHIFALRPTYTLSSPLRSEKGMVNVATTSLLNTLSPSILINTPTIDISLPVVNVQSANPNSGLPEFLQQQFWTLEHKSIILKNRQVIGSRDFVVFCINRKNHEVDFARIMDKQGELPISYSTVLPISISTMTPVNKYAILTYEVRAPISYPTVGSMKYNVTWQDKNITEGEEFRLHTYNYTSESHLRFDLTSQQQTDYPWDETRSAQIGRVYNYSMEVKNIGDVNATEWNVTAIGFSTACKNGIK